MSARFAHVRKNARCARGGVRLQSADYRHSHTSLTRSGSAWSLKSEACSPFREATT